MKRPVLALLGVVALVLLAVVLVRTMRVPPPPPPLASVDDIAVDEAGAPSRLAGAIRFPTISYATGAPIDTAAFLGLHDYLASTFPRVDSSLSREVIGGLSLVYRWPGVDPSLAPVVLMGHMDVVPVPEPTLAQWSHRPFSGDVTGG
ncbi:MAG: peptidase M20, partial [Gemmatimonadales bacterium]